MILKNPKEITERLPIESIVQTRHGKLAYLLWCSMEAQRLRDAGIPAKIRRLRDERGKQLCCVIRTSEGMLEVEELED